MSPYPQIPDYKIEKKLGRGGMGTVYLAFQEKLERMVALKVLSPDLAEESGVTQRFLTEAKIAAQLHHSSIVSIHDVGHQGPYFYFAMEYLERSLKDILRARRDGRIKPDVALNLARQIAQALDYAHKKGVVHRDVKPANILMRNDGTPVLVDFGIAKLTASDAKLTRTGTSVGTPHYMSPEQIQGHELDGRSDFYSLGVVLFEMMTGEVPYQGTDSITIAVKHVRDPIPILTDELAPFQQIIDRLLAKDKRKRVENGGELAEMIDQMQTGAPDTSDEITVIRKAKKAEKRIKPSPASDPAPEPDKAGVRRKGRGIRLTKKSLLPAGVLLVAAAVAAVLIFIKPFSSPPVPEEEALWLEARSRKTAEAYRNYIDQYPDGDHRAEAKRSLAELSEDPRKPTDEATAESDQGEEEYLDLLNQTRLALSAKDHKTARHYLKMACEIRESEETIALARLIDQSEKETAFHPVLRTSPRNLTVEDVQTMLKKRGFFDIHKNKTKTFRNRNTTGSGGRVVLDHATGLMWHRSASSRTMNLNSARNWVTGLNRSGFAGYRDWRLPTTEEAASLLERRRSASGLFADSLFPAKARNIWTCDTLGPQAWIVSLEHGFLDVTWPHFDNFVRPVRNIR